MTDGLTLDERSTVAWATDHRLRITSCFATGSSARKWPVEEAIGRPLADFLQLPNPECPVVVAHHDALQGRTASCRLDAPAGRYHAVVGPHRNGDGSIIGCLAFVQEVPSPYVGGDELPFVGGDELFLGLLEAAPDAMIVSDGNGVILVVNALAERLFGYTREEMFGQPIEMLVPERFRGRHRSHRSDYRTSPHARPMGKATELSALRKDGTEFPAEISLGPMKTAKGVLIFSAVRDVTDRKRIEHDLREKRAQLLAAQRIQEFLLPQSDPTLPGFDVAGAAFPAEFTAGDLFDYLPMSDGSVGLVVGDVSGHGFSSALLMSATLTRFRALAEVGFQPDEIFARANNALYQSTEDGQFVTAILGRLDPHRRTFVYTSAGHPPGYVLDASGAVKNRLESVSFPLAVMPDVDYPTADPVQLDPGDLMLFLTDGVFEADSPDGGAFGVDRTLQIVRDHRHLPARQIIEQLYRAVRDYSAGTKLHDDVTVMVIKVDREQER